MSLVRVTCHLLPSVRFFSREENRVEGIGACGMETILAGASEEELRSVLTGISTLLVLIERHLTSRAAFQETEHEPEEQLPRVAGPPAPADR